MALIDRVGECPEKDAIHYYAQLGQRSDKSRAIKRLDVGWMLLTLISNSGHYSFVSHYKRMLPWEFLADHLKSKENPAQIR